MAFESKAPANLGSMSNTNPSEQIRDEALDLAVLDYLMTAFPKSGKALLEEADLRHKKLPVPGTLAAKWTSTTRMHLKVAELERQLKESGIRLQLYEASSKVKAGSEDGLPSGTPVRVLEGHRKPVTCVRFHPTFFLLLTGSDDGSIMVWDFESGKLEKSLKGHTEGVNDVACNKTGLPQELRLRSRHGHFSRRLCRSLNLRERRRLTPTVRTPLSLRRQQRLYKQLGVGI
eukprot:Selendium_serpulae@DN3961_c0_g1_i5.p1